MTDRLTPERRSWLMSRIRGKDTVPELRVRKLLHGMGYRFRLHQADLPGKPDIVFRSRKKIILVHGCYWHGHSCRRGQAASKTNVGFWQAKIQRNMKRDRRTAARLRKLGWSVAVVWECQTQDDARLRRLVRFLES